MHLANARLESKDERGMVRGKNLRGKHLGEDGLHRQSKHFFSTPFVFFVKDFFGVHFLSIT
jgi:hypothetical protein